MAEDFQIVDPVKHDGWDSLLLASGDTDVFHTAAWARVLGECYGYEPCYLVRQKADRLESLLPLMEVRSWLTGRRGVSLPFSDECGPFCPDADTAQALVGAARELGSARHWRYLELRGGARLTPEMRPSLSHFAHVLDLSVGEERLHGGLNGATRTAIRKAAREAVTVRVETTLESLRSFYRLNCLTRRMHGLPPQSWTFFQKVHDHILCKNLGMVALAEWQRQPIAGAVCFHFGPRAVYKYAASDRRHQSLNGNNLVLWEVIRWYAARGAATLALGRTEREHEGLRRFKLGWGAREYVLEYFKYDFRRRAFVEDRSRVSGWHNRLFRQMPIPVARAAGALLYRHMA